MKNIWVIPEISGKTDEISKFSLGLMNEAAAMAATTGATARAILLATFGDDYRDAVTSQGISEICVLKDPLLEHYSAEGWTKALAPLLQTQKPWLVLMGDTLAGREVAPALAILLGTAVVPGCVKIDWSNLEAPVFYRPVYGGQAYQEIVYRRETSMVVTMDPHVLTPSAVRQLVPAKVRVFGTELRADELHVSHVEFQPSDFHTVDVSEAGVVVGAGLGAAEEVMPLVKELADLIEGSIGATRPVIDEGTLTRERLIGQTGKVISPELYLALGVSGATHHTGGIQQSKTIVAINRDRQAPIFQSSDAGAVADLKDILPALIARIRQARERGEII